MTEELPDHDELRRLGFSIAYRMLGSAAEAEDVVQEALLRLHRARAGGEEVAEPRAYVTTVTTRLAIDELRSARARRVSYVGPWLPEPLVVAGEEDDPAAHAELGDSLSMAFLVLLETLSPVERAVLLLREAFDYGYDEIAQIVGRSEDNCRQLLSRARARIAAGRPRFDPEPEARAALAERFFAAARDGDVAALEELLAADVVFYGDGGGKASALPEPMHGVRRVQRFVLSLFAQARRRDVTVRPALVNGQPGALTFDADGALVTVLTLDVADGRVQAIRSVVNPDKLAHLGLPLSDLARRRRPAPPHPDEPRADAGGTT
jgi:RNA polymerase sigma-70 factor (ECF subfamily)